jgi:hypothetical protein
MDILPTIIGIHDELVEFGSNLQGVSARRMETPTHIGKCIYFALTRINSDAICLHRAVLSLCGEGWAPITPILLRPMMECSSNCLAIIKNSCPEFMAYKYIHHSLLQMILDSEYPKDKSAAARSEMEGDIEYLVDASAKAKARGYIDAESVDIFWFKPEEKSVSKIIKNFGSAELKSIYGTLSISVHAGYYGMSLFKDDPTKLR